MATTKDHVPPKSFFPSPRPSNLITVPCCDVCNSKYGKGDERARNLLTSLETTETHPGIQNQIARKRNRSFLRHEGRSDFQHILRSIKLVDRYSPGDIYLGKYAAFDLNQGLMDRFMERMTRALIYQDNSIGYVDFEIEWRMAPTKQSFESMPSEMKTFLASAEPREIGDNVFIYLGYYCLGRASSLWIMNFYGGVEFITILRDKSGGGRQRNERCI